jgi:cilia- and flagella-associated protein 300
MVNEDSENSSLFPYKEKNELLFRIFKCLVVGGGLCQCDDRIVRYLDMTKKLYKEMLTVYKNATTDQPEIAGKAFSINNVPGLDLYGDAAVYGGSDEGVAENVFIIVVDPSKRQLTVMKKVMASMW